MAHRRVWLLVAAAVVAVVIAWLAVMGPRLATRRIVAELPAPRFVRPGAPLFYAGLAIGRVRDVECRDSVAVIVLAVDHPDLPLTRAHRVRRIQMGPIGDDAVELVAPNESAPRLEASDTLRGLAPTAPARADSILVRQLATLGWRVTRATEGACQPTTR